MLTAILYSEVNLLCILFLLMMYIKSNAGNDAQMRQIRFQHVLLSNCVFFALDILWVWVDSRSFIISRWANWTLNGLYYIVSGIVGYCWFLYSEQVQNSKLVSDKKYRLLCAVPMLILDVFTMASLKTGWMFFIDEANVYHRGPLYGLQLLFSYGYVLFTTMKALLLSFRPVQYTQRITYRMLARYVIAPLVAGIIQVFVPGISSLCVGTTVGALYVFLSMQEQLISEDMLTGLSNRSKLMSHLDAKMQAYDGKKNLFLVMMDLDYFKSINDGYGHVEGDRALCLTADVLKSCCRDRNCFIARYGGDEFTAVCEEDDEEQMQAFCQSIAVKLQEKSKDRPYQLSLSMGYAQYSPEIKSDQELIRLADEKLYQVKRIRHKRMQ